MAQTPRPLSTECGLHTQRRMPHLQSLLYRLSPVKTRAWGGREWVFVCCTVRWRSVWFLFRTLRHFCCLAEGTRRRQRPIPQGAVLPAVPEAGKEQGKGTSSMKPMGKKSGGALLMAGVMALLVAALALTLYQEAALPAGEEPAALAAEEESFILGMSLWHPITRSILLILLFIAVIFLPVLILVAVLLTRKHNR